MIEVMMFLALAPVIGLGLTLIILVIMSFVSESGTTHSTMHIEMPEGKPENTVTPKEPNPTIAEQFDGRLTNIVRNPLEGIL